MCDWLVAKTQWWQNKYNDFLFNNLFDMAAVMQPEDAANFLFLIDLLM